MRLCLTTALSLLCFAAPVWPETTSCTNARYTVTAQDPALISMTCQATEQAEEAFSLCGLQHPTDPVRIDLVTELDEGCVGLYHCGENWIEVLEPSLLSQDINPSNVFAYLPVEDYFRSIVVHELTHQLLDNMPCPFKACPAGQEYVAFSLQIMSLTQDQRDVFDATHGLDDEISRAELNAIILYVAPNLFARKAWTHLNRREDPCGFIHDIMDGSVVLDFEPL